MNLQSENNYKQPYDIAFLMNGAKPPRGGEFLSLSLITHLRRDIFNPVLIYAKEGIIVKKIKESGMPAIQFHLDDKLADIYPRKIKLYNPLFILTFLGRLFISGSVSEINKLVKENNIHLIYCADNLSKLIGGIVGKMTKIKVVAHCHDQFENDILGKVMKFWYLLFLERILAVSEKVRKFFTINGKISQKAVTVYNGVDTDIFDPDKVNGNIKAGLGLNEDTVVIGSIGTLEEDKGQMYLFEAIARLKAEGIDNIACIVCGTGHKEECLKKYVKQKNLDKTVLFLGFRDDIPRILKALDILVMTSMTIESFSMAAVEAMAMKIPVIATNAGAFPEVVDDGETGILIPPRDVEALCSSLRYLIENPEEMAKMGEKGREKVRRRFTIEENVKKTEEIFLEILRGSI